MRKPVGRPPAPLTAVRLDFATEEFLSHLRSEGAAKATVAVKKTVMNVLVEQMGKDFPVWGLTNTEFGKVRDKAVLGETVEEAAEHGRFGRAVRTGRHTKEGREQVRSTLKQFIVFCSRNHAWLDKTTYVPERLFKPKKTNSSGERPVLPARFVYDDWPVLLDVAETVHPRCAIATAIGLYLARRASEVIEMKWKHIDWDRGVIEFYDEKNDELLEMPLYPEIRKELEWWRDWMVEHFGEIDPEWYVVPAKLQSRDIKGAGAQVRLRDFPEQWPLDPAKQSRVSSMVREARRLLGKLGYASNQKTGTHTWRRSSATYVSETHGILAAQALLGHKLITTTQKYTRNSDGKRRLWEALMPGATPPGGWGLENVEARQEHVGTTEQYVNVIPINRRRAS